MLAAKKGWSGGACVWNYTQCVAWLLTHCLADFCSCLQVNCFRTIIATTPEDLLATIYLCTNKVAPAHEGVELGIGDATLVKVHTTQFLFARSSYNTCVILLVALSINMLDVDKLHHVMTRVVVSAQY